MSAKKAEACQACGSTDRLVTLEDAKHRTVAVLCRGRRTYGEEPSKVCLNKFLERRPTCLICGTESLYFSGAVLRPICKECEQTLSQVREDQKERACYVMSTYSVFGRALPVNGHIDYDTIGRAFRRTLCGENYESFVGVATNLLEKSSDTWREGSFSTGDIWARLTPAQAEGARSFVEALHKLLADVARVSHEQGNAVLVRLARGEVSLDDYNDGRLPARKR